MFDGKLVESSSHCVSSIPVFVDIGFGGLSVFFKPFPKVSGRFSHV